jgi:CheY-like chemotaxis protein
MRVLVAETDIRLLAEMKHALEQAGHDVTISNDGMHAWGYLAGAAPPDVLVTRIRLGTGMPPGTALGMRAQSSQPPIPVIYIPANAERAEHADPEHGAVLLKPFVGADLVETIARLTGNAETG